REVARLREPEQRGGRDRCKHHHFLRNDRWRRLELWPNIWSGRSRHTAGPLDWSAHLLVGTKKIAPAPGVVHAWRRSYLQPWTGHQPAGALARHICILFCSACGDVGYEAISRTAAVGNCYARRANAGGSWSAESVTPRCHVASPARGNALRAP